MEEAEQLLADVSAAIPDDASLHYELGRLCLDREDLQAAFVYLDIAARLKTVHESGKVKYFCPTTQNWLWLL